jgi:probable F420-dependent oxidoreductase
VAVKFVGLLVMPLTLGAVLWGRSADAFRERASALEQVGFGSFSVGDHLGHYPPLTACAVVAAATEKARVGPLVLNNDFREPSVLAREAAALADLSGGRFELGLGAGYARREYEWAGIAYEPAAIRIARLAEAAHILSRLFAGEQVTFEGEHYSTAGDSLQGLPLQHRVRLLIGGNSPALLAVAARYADIVNFAGLSSIRGGTVEDMTDFSADALERQVHSLAAAPREVAGDLERHVLVQWHEVTDDRQGAAERAATHIGVPVEVILDSPYVVIGSVDEIAAQLHSHADRFGIVRWTIFADHPELQPGEAFAPVITALAR